MCDGHCWHIAAVVVVTHEGPEVVEEDIELISVSEARWRVIDFLPFEA